MKKLFALISALTVILALCACAGNARENDLSKYDGAWTNGADILILSSEKQSYILDRRGRVGSGSFYLTNGKAGIYFNSSIYTLSLGDDGLSLTQSGQSYVTERIGASVFVPTDASETPVFTFEDMAGEWENEYGERLEIDPEDGSFVFASQQGVTEGTAGDEKQGRGPFFAAEGRYMYVIMSADLSGFSLRCGEEDEKVIRGHFTRK
ncbi:MAG: hypothetical protein ILP09_00860 [Oscillospiraceae bacterium]|nr:hypothetical protein [Oscillospiraceae bacterium]